jgi:large subunit ribosomal protein L1
MLLRQLRKLSKVRLTLRLTRAGIVHTSIGKVSFTSEQILQNAKSLSLLIIKLKPASAKGTYIKSIFISSTMSKGIKIDPKSVE